MNKLQDDENNNKEVEYQTLSEKKPRIDCSVCFRNPWFEGTYCMWGKDGYTCTICSYRLLMEMGNYGMAERFKNKIDGK